MSNSRELLHHPASEVKLGYITQIRKHSLWFLEDTMSVSSQDEEELEEVLIYSQYPIKTLTSTVIEYEKEGQLAQQYYDYLQIDELEQILEFLDTYYFKKTTEEYYEDDSEYYDDDEEGEEESQVTGNETWISDFIKGV